MRHGSESADTGRDHTARLMSEKGRPRNRSPFFLCKNFRQEEQRKQNNQNDLRSHVNYAGDDLSLRTRTGGRALAAHDAAESSRSVS